MADYEAQRLSNIARNKALIAELGIKRDAPQSSRQPSAKRKRVSIEAKPSRVSARIASAPLKKSYTEDDDGGPRSIRVKSRRDTHIKPIQDIKPVVPLADDPARSDYVKELRNSWTAWKPTAPSPTRNALTGALHFPSHPIFTPNKTPEEMLREGVFGGSYFRRLYSKALGITVSDDWEELPKGWVTGLDVETSLTSPTYNRESNKFKVSCGQSIEEWEAAGWIAHDYDVRGWFQWYCRFYMGRRCEDDERQVGRWRRCVGDTGRWRRTLLKKYVKLGIREVFDDGEREDEEEVSPVVHQTCLQWGFEVRQEVLDEFWRTGN